MPQRIEIPMPVVSRHSYTDPDATEKGKQFNIPFAYDAEATLQSRAEALKFFGKVFK